MSFRLRSLAAFALLCTVAPPLLSTAVAKAGTPPAFPLYCHGGGHMKTEILVEGVNVQVDTTYKWSDKGADTAAPARGECAWADRAPRGSEIKPGYSNFICDFGQAPFHAIFGAGKAVENSGENLPLNMAPIVVEFPGVPKFSYIPRIISDDDEYFEFTVYRDPSEVNCMHATSFLGSVKPPFSAVPALRHEGLARPPIH